jgi:hypothetical protein
VSTTLHHIYRCLILLPLLFSASAVHAERTFRWIDEDGQVNYGDRVPPRYAIKERKEINEQGRTVKVYAAPRTPEQKAEDRRQAIIAAAKKKIAERRLRHDRTLLATYSSEEDMQLARDGKVASVETLIQLTHRRIKSMQKRLLKLTDEAAEYERSGKELPSGLQQQIISLREQIIQNENFVKDKDREMEAIRLQFIADIKRFTELTGDDPQAAAAQLPDMTEIERELEALNKPPEPLPKVSKKPGKKRANIKLSRHDRTLLATYKSEDEILRERENKIGSVNAAMRKTAASIDSLQADLTGLVDNADEYESNDQRPPEMLMRQMKAVLDDIAKDEGSLGAWRREKRDIERKFELDLARYREITVGTVDTAEY